MMTDIASKEWAPDSVYGAAIVGGRAEQQDYFCIHPLNEPRSGLLVLGDGMGGHPGGDVASKLAVNGFITAFISLSGGGASIRKRTFRCARRRKCLCSRDAD